MRECVSACGCVCVGECVCQRKSVCAISCLCVGVHVSAQARTLVSIMSVYWILLS